MGARLIELADKFDAEMPEPADLALIEGGALSAPPHFLPPDNPSYLARFAQALLRARRLRDRMLPSDLFADPAWDMLLDLYVHSALGRQLSVTAVCGASHVPATTALRWIELLENEGLVRRSADPLDGRRRFIELSQVGETILTNLLGAMEIQITQRNQQRLFRFKETVS